MSYCAASEKVVIQMGLTRSTKASTKPSKMKTNLELLNDCDQKPPVQPALYKFKISGYDGSFGTMLEEIVRRFSWCERWDVDHVQRVVTLKASNMAERNRILHETLIQERAMDTFKLLRNWRGEVFPVYGPGKELVLSIERAAAPLFGVVTYGVQLLAYQDTAEGYKIWVARRAKTKSTFPGMLDSTVGGSLPTGETPFECLVRESEEEASFPPKMTRQMADACGTLNYLCLTDERSGGEIGCFTPEIQFLYEMKVEQDVVPIPGDNEAEEITLMNIEQLKEALAKGEFTPANGCVVLDFFIRHGLLTFENEPDYIEIAARLHRVHDFQTA